MRILLNVPVAGLGAVFIGCGQGARQVSGIDAALSLPPLEKYESSFLLLDNDDLLIAVMEGNMAVPEGVVQHSLCTFSIKKKGDYQLYYTITHRHDGYDVAPNPAVAKGPDGTLWATCFSAKDDYTAGVIEVTSSHDNGRTWDQWHEVLALVNGTPDKPWLSINADGTLGLIYSELQRAPVDPTHKFEFQMTSEVKLTLSKDNGRTWSSHVSVSGSPTPCSSDHCVNGAGASSIISPIPGKFLMSYGTYKHEVFLAEVDTSGGTIQNSQIAVQASDYTGGLPLTQLYGVDQNTAFLSWHDAHSFGSAYLTRVSVPNLTGEAPQLLGKSASAVAVATLNAKQIDIAMVQTSVDGTSILLQGITSYEIGTVPTKWQTLSIEKKPSYDALYLGAFQTIIAFPDHVAGFLMDFSQGYSDLKYREFR